MNDEPYINSIKDGSIGKDKQEEIFTNILNGKINEEDTIKILEAFNCKNITSSDLFIISKILLKNAIKIKSPLNSIDIVGTGGDGLHTYNISTASAFVVAGCDIAVAKHGNKSVSSKSGASDVLQELGINVTLEPKKVEEILNNENIAFLMAPIYHSSMRNVASARAKMKKRTIFNFIGPLVNPSSVKKGLFGVSDSKMQQPMAECLKKLGYSDFWMVNANNNMDEVSNTCDTNVIQYKDSKFKEFTICPKDFNIPVASINDITGGTPKDNAKELINVLNGNKSHYYNAVILNSACALLATDNANSVEHALELATKSIENKNALQKLNALQKQTQKK